MKAAIIVIDMIEDFVTGELGFEGAKVVVPKIRRLIDVATARKVPVIYVCDAHLPEDPEIRIWGKHGMVGSKGAQVISELKLKGRGTTLQKRTYDIFFDTGLDKLLRRKGIRELVLTGVATEICVQNSAAGAFFRGYDVVVPEDCVASSDERAHQNALNYMKRVYGAKIVSLDELVGRWEASV